LQAKREFYISLQSKPCFINPLFDLPQLNRLSCRLIGEEKKILSAAQLA
jgi:hypothetical protein